MRNFASFALAKSDLQSIQRFWRYEHFSENPVFWIWIQNGSLDLFSLITNFSRLDKCYHLPHDICKSVLYILRYRQIRKIILIRIWIQNGWLGLSAPDGFLLCMVRAFICRNNHDNLCIIC